MRPREDPCLGLPGAQRPMPAGGLLQAVPCPREWRGGEQVVPWLCHPITLLPAPGPRVRIPMYPQTVSAALLCASQPWPPLLEEIPCWDPSPAFPRESSTVGKGEVRETSVLEEEREQTEQALGSVCGPRHSEWVCAHACERELAGGVNRVLNRVCQEPPALGGRQGESETHQSWSSRTPHRPMKKLREINVTR